MDDMRAKDIGSTARKFEDFRFKNVQGYSIFEEMRNEAI